MISDVQEVMTNSCMVHVNEQVHSQGDKIAHISDENGQLQAEMHFMKRNLQTAEHRLQSGQSLMQQAESEVPNRLRIQTIIIKMAVTYSCINT